VPLITVTYAPSAAASDARSEAAGDAVPLSRPGDNADEAGARRAGEPSTVGGCPDKLRGSPADVTIIRNTSTKY